MSVCCRAAYGRWSSASEVSETRRTRAPATPHDSAPGACGRCARGRYAQCGARVRAARVGLAFEARATDDLPALLLDDPEAVPPGIGPLTDRAAQQVEPLRGDVARNVKPPQFWCGGQRGDFLKALRLLEQYQKLIR